MTKDKFITSLSKYLDEVFKSWCNVDDPNFSRYIAGHVYDWIKHKENKK